jgi:chromosome segregation ATPase
MTGEEMERAIEFLLQSQANSEGRLERIEQQVAETSRQLQAYAETQTEFIQIVTGNIQAQAEINASMRDSIRELKDTQHELKDTQRELKDTQRELKDTQLGLTAVQSRTDERLDRLAATVERFITEGRNGNSQQ